MRGNTLATPVQQFARAAAPRRLLSAVELLETLVGAVDSHVPPQQGAAWRDLRLVSLSLCAGGELTLPPASFYSVLGMAGGIVLGNPGEASRVRWTERQHATLVCIEPRLLRAAAAECGLGASALSLRVGAAPADAVCERLLSALAEEAKAAAYPLQELVVESIGNALAYRLVTRHAGAGAQVADVRGSLNERAFNQVSAFIEQHIDQRLGLDDLARVAGVSRFHFARQFRLRTGESPMGFLLRARIERGKRLLLDCSASIGDVAASLGFADQSHFTRTFKRLVGVPPREYKGGQLAISSRRLAITSS